MRVFNFTKMVAAGNDFVVTEVKSQKSKVKSLNILARKICDRKYGVGADGLLVLGKSKIADIMMRIFNADGSEAEMCGNGARCVALWAKSKVKSQKSKLKIETLSGIIESKVQGDNVRIKLTDPFDIKLSIPLLVNDRELRVNFINTGVPHVVIFCEAIDKINVFELGKIIRNHKAFAPAGTNVNFVEIVDSKNIKVRTYERGVEDETLACGTGSMASSLISSLVQDLDKKQINVQTKSGEKLKIYFTRLESTPPRQESLTGFTDVWLEGKAKIVFEGRLQPLKRKNYNR